MSNRTRKTTNNLLPFPDRKQEIYREKYKEERKRIKRVIDTYHAHVRALYAMETFHLQQVQTEDTERALLAINYLIEYNGYQIGRVSKS